MDLFVSEEITHIWLSFMTTLSLILFLAKIQPFKIIYYALIYLVAAKAISYQYYKYKCLDLSVEPLYLRQLFELSLRYTINQS